MDFVVVVIIVSLKPILNIVPGAEIAWRQAQSASSEVGRGGHVDLPQRVQLAQQRQLPQVGGAQPRGRGRGQAHPAAGVKVRILGPPARSSGQAGQTQPAAGDGSSACWRKSLSAQAQSRLGAYTLFLITGRSLCRKKCVAATCGRWMGCSE